MKVAELASVLTDEAAKTPGEVFQRCASLEQLSVLGANAYSAMPAIIRSLYAPVSVDCGLALRVAAAEAAWKVGDRRDIALPLLAWALKDEYWGVSRKAVDVLSEMGVVAHDAVPDLVALARRRMKHGPFHFEVADLSDQPASILVAVAHALGRCGNGVAHIDAARDALAYISGSANDADSSAAQIALRILNGR